MERIVKNGSNPFSPIHISKQNPCCSFRSVSRVMAGERGIVFVTNIVLDTNEFEPQVVDTNFLCSGFGAARHNMTAYRNLAKWDFIPNTCSTQQLYDTCWLFQMEYSPTIWPGIILAMGSVNKRCHYNVVSSLIGWAQTQNDPCIINVGHWIYWIGHFEFQIIAYHINVIMNIFYNQGNSDSWTQDMIKMTGD